MVVGGDQTMLLLMAQLVYTLTVCVCVNDDIDSVLSLRIGLAQLTTSVKRVIGTLTPAHAATCTIGGFNQTNNWCRASE